MSALNVTVKYISVRVWAKQPLLILMAFIPHLPAASEEKHEIPHSQ
jgi:hypothetical protein